MGKGLFVSSTLAVIVAASGLAGCDADRAEAAPKPSGSVTLDDLVASAQPQVTSTPASAETMPAAVVKEKPPASDADVLTLSAVGDCTLGDPAESPTAKGSFHRAHDDSGGDMARPFSGVISVLGSDDLTFANLEGTLTTAKCRTDVAFAFRGRPAFAQMLAKGSVDAVNLSNNHSFDCENAGLVETRKSLSDAGVGYFGMGSVDVRTVKGIEVHSLGYLGGRMEVKAEMMKAVAKEKRPDNLVIVQFHWGIEGSHVATNVQQKLAHAAIDAGADLVIGHHPHVLQGIEAYQGKTIVYSLGNFVFGGNAHPANLDSMIFQAQFQKKDGKVVPIGTRIIPVQFSGDPKQNDFRPVLVSESEAARIEKLVKETYSKGIGGS